MKSKETNIKLKMAEGGNLQGIFFDDWSPDYQVYKKIYRAVFELCEICMHGPNYVQKLSQKQRNAG